MSQKPSLVKLQKHAEAARVSDFPVKEFMSQSSLNIMIGTKIYTAIQALNTHQLSGAPVVDSAQRLEGMISEYDLLMQAATRDLSDPITYTAKVMTLSPETTLREAIVIFYKTKYRRLPVISSTGKVLGIVSRIDVLKKLIHEANAPKVNAFSSNPEARKSNRPK